MRVFVCETVSGGDYAGVDLPETLIAEGAMMRDALIADLVDLPGVHVLTTHDARLPAPPRGESRAISAQDDTRAIWSDLAARADCCWPIAPECEGILHTLVEQLEARNGRVIACDVETLQICSSKLRTATHLAAAGIAVVPSWSPSTVPPGLSGPLVIKPDDGAGAMDVHVFRRLPPGPYPAGVVIQPFIVGAAASLTLLCQSGRTQVLTANRQHVVEFDGQLILKGLTVGAFPVDDSLRALADAIGAALPGLHGMLGIDYIATQAGPVVLEINPRLTTSYVGLRRALGINPLAFVAELVQDGAVPDMRRLPPTLPVEISL
ncbi:ATP-grasp domain-containing protein [Ancylobacter sp. SL191]|uniref:ATP-grasp domain-containing protein n=1 Tax=Ancylobacter sp. SL191 TaxID=2995166 RepID=UPI002271C365|nr:ATP-grasp domain-containing protein [Ancylobacter sp. SL191]WAC27239.1 ATP-grasp domain-containing protein [Ancylobacter sp. SL191]